jgi:hypothetical protein
MDHEHSAAAVALLDPLFAAQENIEQNQSSINTLHSASLIITVCSFIVNRRL